MVVEDEVFELVVNQFGRCVVITFYLVTDDINLMFQLVLRVFTAKNDIAKQVDSSHEMFTLDGGIEYGIFFVSKGVKITSHALKTVENLECRTVTGSLERRMLAKVS